MCNHAISRYFNILCLCLSCIICAVYSINIPLQEKQELILLDRSYFSNSSNPFRSQNCHNLFWFHAPKTSSTLCTTLEHLCCPENFDRVVSHLNEDNYVADIGVSHCTLLQFFNCNIFHLWID